jgi:hypothetical protein
MSNLPNSQFTKAEDLKIQILADIELLGKIENDLTQSLQNTQLTLVEKNKIETKITSVTTMKIQLFSILNEINIYLQNTLSNANNTLIDQTFALNIIENEIQQSRDRLTFLQEDKYNKYRQVEINTYYSQKYSEHNKLILWIISILAILTLIVYLNKKNIISYTIYFWLLLLTTIFGVIIITYKINNLLKRNNMNYQEYDINFDLQKYKPSSKTSNVQPVDPWETEDTPICMNR